METPREVPDELWAVIEPLLPVVVPRGPGGRPRADDRKMLDAILYVLWTGMPWRALTKAGFGPWQTVYDRFAEWKRANLYEDIWAACLRLYDAKHGIDFEWQAEDGTYVRSPLGGKSERAQPDRPRKTGNERPRAD